MIKKSYIRGLFEGYLPHEILYRQKDAFSNAVAYNYIDELKEKFKNEQPHTDSKLIEPIPRTGEENYYQRLYIENYGCQQCIPYYWLPNQEWVKVEDSSACELKIHNVNLVK